MSLHPRDDIDGLYVSKKEGGRGFASIEDSMEASIRLLEDYIKKSKESLLTATRKRNNNKNSETEMGRKTTV